MDGVGVCVFASVSVCTRACVHACVRDVFAIYDNDSLPKADNDNNYNYYPIFHTNQAH